LLCLNVSAAFSVIKQDNTEHALLNQRQFQGDHSPGKPGKVREFQIGQEKSGKMEKVREADICFIVQSIYQ